MRKNRKTVVVENGVNSQENNFLQTELANVGGIVWNDLNQDGIRNDGDLSDIGISGVEVRIYDALTNSIVATTTTDLEGHYMFINLMPGDYFLQFTLPDGFQVSPIDQGGDNTMDSDVDPNNNLQTPIVELLPGNNLLSLDMGVSPAPTDLDSVDEPTAPMPYRLYLPSVAR